MELEILYVEFRNFQEGSGGLTKEVGGFGGGQDPSKTLRQQKTKISKSGHR